MKFRTEIKINKAEFEINHKSNIFLIGSCFSNNIGDKFKQNKFNTLINPYGVLYNPMSIYNSLNFIVENKKFNKTELLEYNNKWISLDHHGSFSNNDINKTLEKINDSNSNANTFLHKTNILFVTFGTAKVYKYKKTNKIVANCHKIPQKEFINELLNLNETVGKYNKLISKLQKVNSQIKIIFTVSPIRHLKDGFHENQISKSILFTIINEIIKNNKNTFYFPTYEIINDDLRDYRFYTDDLIHISDIAINYIWDKIADAYFSNETIIINNEIQKITKALNHKPFDKNSDNYKKFISDLSNKIINFEKKYNIKLIMNS